jgi:outer membrane receptor protein involved in Fe transport
MRNLMRGVFVAVLLLPATIYANDLSIFLFDDKGPVDNVTVLINGENLGRTDVSGGLNAPLEQGNKKVVLKKADAELVSFNFKAASGEGANISIKFSQDADPVVAVDTYKSDSETSGDTTAKGLLKGVIKSRSSGASLPEAKLVIEQLDIVATADVFGKYQIELPRGAYEILVTHPEAGSRTFSDVEIVAYVTSELDFAIGRQLEIVVPVMEEISVVGTYFPEGFRGITVERSASAVTDVLDREALTRFGGSTAAAALQRVVGISVASNKFVVIRGLNERHTAVTLNGASIPSPDPSRRVVPLDIFPSAILQGIEVQKAATPDQPVDSTGGTVTLKTREYPKEFEGNFSFALGYVDGLTGKTRTVQQEESDILGYGADDRSLPAVTARLQELVPQGLATQQDRIDAAIALGAGALPSRTVTVDPNFAFELGVGDTLAEFDNGLGLSYLLSLDYSNKWAKEDSERRTYINTSGQQLLVLEEFDYARTENNIDLSLGFSVGLTWGAHQIDSNTYLLRQSQAETNVSTGLQSIERNLQVKTEHRWNEREFLMQQLVGQHDFEFLSTNIVWDFSVASASLDSPDQREIIFRGSSPDNDPTVTLDDVVYFSANRRFVELDDDSTGYDADFTSTVYEGDSLLAKLKYGVNYFDREREAETQRFLYIGAATGPLRDETRIENVINNDTITAGSFQLTTNTQPTDTYTATWEMLAFYLSTELEFGEKWRVLVGARSEDSDLIVNTFVDAPGQAIPETVRLDEQEVFSSFNIVYLLTEELQFRLGVYETKNRPDFRELANAQFIDPESGDLFRGNSRLESAEIDNLDFRAEWYFSDSESMTIAYFNKDFINAIEKTVRVVGGSSELFGYSNADKGNISGFELDFKREFDFSGYALFLSGNLAIIDSEVTLTSLTGSQTVTRNMQGQPDSLYNVQLGLDDAPGGREYTLVYYRVGESIDSVSQGLPEIMQEPRSEIDLSFAQAFGESRDYKLKAKLKNITDKDVMLTQGGQLYRRYKKGTELEIGFGIEF